ncbi:YciI family protein [Yoonia sp. BS5-3]|uniref:YciI family protein n=1 Tax=Yoonia phaeophyticola TaxID=3137369 RepID=A0ABZ2V6M2_9RHOB
MQYMCLIYSAEGSGPQPGTDEFGPFMKAYGDYTAQMRESGALVHADALQPVATATTVTVRNGQTITTDGPFAETKEQLGGYYLLECENLDDAIAKAARIPTATYGRIEIRPIIVWDD